MNLGSAYLSTLTATDRGPDDIASARAEIIRRLHLAARDTDAVPLAELTALYDTLRQARLAVNAWTNDGHKNFEHGAMDSIALSLTLIIGDRELVQPLAVPANRGILDFLATPDRSPEFSLEEILAAVPTASEATVRALMGEGYLFAAIRNPVRLALIRLTAKGEDALALAKRLLPV